MKKEYLALAIIIAALAIYLTVQKRDDLHYSLPQMQRIGSDKVAGLNITGPSASIAIKRKEGRWRIMPEGFAADGPTVDAMVDEASGLDLTALVSESGSYTVFGLDEAGAIGVELLGDGGVLRSFEIGKTASSRRHTFVRIDGDGKVYHAVGDLRSKFDKNTPDLRDRAVMSIEEEIREIRLLGGGAETVIARSLVSAQKEGNAPEDQPAAEWFTAGGEPVDSGKIREIVDTLSGLKCDGFVEDLSKDDLGEPSFRVLLMGDSDMQYRLSLFDKDEDRYVASSSGSDYPFYLSSWNAERIMKGPEDLVIKR
jgi:hypothetical protein